MCSSFMANTFPTEVGLCGLITLAETVDNFGGRVMLKPRSQLSATTPAGANFNDTRPARGFERIVSKAALAD